MAAPFRSRNSRSPHRAARPCLELLEPRLALSGSPTIAMVGDTLTVEGTPGPDRIRIMPTPLSGTFRVVFNGKVAGTFGPATKLNVDAGGGNDTVTVDPRATLPTQLDGGAGNDSIRGGSGPNFLNGGVGRNTLIGNPIRDTFDDDSGQNRLVFVKSLGTIQVGPSASGPALRGLSGPFTLRPLQVTGPAIVGAADLRDGRIVDLLRNDFNAGQTVAIANATTADADTLASLLGYEGRVALPDGVARADMITFRRIDQDGRTLFSTSVLLPTVGVSSRPARQRAGNRASNQAIRAFQANVFSTTPSIPAAPTITDPQSNLIQIAAGYQTNVFQPDQVGNYVQVVNMIYSARSFLNQADLYYVNQEVDYHNAVTVTKYPIPSVPNLYWVNLADNLPNLSLTSPKRAGLLTLQPGPQSNPGATTITSGVNYSLGGTVGYNVPQGFNVSSPLGLAITNSTTTTVPPIVITYQGGPAVHTETQWQYQINPHSDALPPQTITTYNQWIWEVPFNAYEANPTSFKFTTTAALDFVVWNGAFGDHSRFQVTAFHESSVPLPLGDTFQLGSPTVTGVSTPTVKPGDTFTIEGQSLYPSTVQAVLIGGVPLSADNFKPVSDTKIQVVAPNMLGSSLPVVVKTSQGLSNANITITIGGTSQFHVQAQPVAAVAGQAVASQPVATFTDSDPNAKTADFAAKIDWGDGSTSDGTITAAGPGAFNVLGTHTYVAAGNYTFNVQVTDPSGTKAAAAGTATVAAPDTGGPQNLVTQPVAAVAGQAFTNVTVATFADSVLGVNPADFTAAITWGDGTSTPSTTVTIAGSGTFNVLGTHTYVAAGTYPFSVQVTDNKGRKVTATGTATVSNA